MGKDVEEVPSSTSLPASGFGRCIANSEAWPEIECMTRHTIEDCFSKPVLAPPVLETEPARPLKDLGLDW